MVCERTDGPADAYIQALAWARNQAIGMPWAAVAQALVVGIDRSPLAVLPIVGCVAVLGSTPRPRLEHWSVLWGLRLGAAASGQGNGNEEQCASRPPPLRFPPAPGPLPARPR